MQSAYSDIPRTVSPSGEGPDTLATDMLGRHNEMRKWLAELEKARYSPKRSVIYLGDSITGRGGQFSADAKREGIGYTSWTQLLTHERLVPIYNAGVAGETLGMIESRLQADVIDRSPGVCVFLGGINDIKGAPATTLATMQATLTRMLDALYGAGIYVIVCTIPGTDLLDLASEKAQWHRWNRWLIALGQTRRGMTVCDLAPDVTDTVNPVWAANMSNDGTHSNSRGSAEMADRLAQTISTLFPPALWLPPTGGDADELVANPRMNGNTSGAATGVAAVNATLTKVARTDRPGEWQQAAYAAGATGTVLVDVTAGFTVGEQVYATWEFETDASWAGVSTHFFAIEFRDAANVVLSTNDNLHDATHTNQPRPPSGIMRTNLWTIPANTTRIRLLQRLVLAVGGTAVVRFGTMSLRKAGT